MCSRQTVENVYGAVYRHCAPFKQSISLRLLGPESLLQETQAFTAKSGQFSSILAGLSRFETIGSCPE
jgi:hypothetical protein